MKNTKNLGLDVILPAGSYYIGDLCYVMPDKLWDEWLNHTAVYDADGNLQEYEDGAYEFHGVRVCWHGTAHGDGTYRSNRTANVSNSNAVWVDSGTIGIIALSKLTEWLTHEQLDEVMAGKLGLVHRFDNQFFVTLDHDSDFGPINVKTTDSDDYDYWDEEY